MAARAGGPFRSEMALTSFPDGSYLELIAIQPQADPKAVAANQWHRCLETNGGPCGWAVQIGNGAHQLSRWVVSRTDRHPAASRSESGCRQSVAQVPGNEWRPVRVGRSSGGYRGGSGSPARSRHCGDGRHEKRTPASRWGPTGMGDGAGGNG